MSTALSRRSLLSFVSGFSGGNLHGPGPLLAHHTLLTSSSNPGKVPVLVVAANEAVEHFHSVKEKKEDREKRQADRSVALLDFLPGNTAMSTLTKSH